MKKLKFEFTPSRRKDTIHLELLPGGGGTVLLTGDTGDGVGPWTLVQIFPDGSIALHPRGTHGAGLKMCDWDLAHRNHSDLRYEDPR